MLVRDAQGRLACWTFAGGVVNVQLARELTANGYKATADDFCIEFSSSAMQPAVQDIRCLLEQIDDAAHGNDDDDATDGLKFSACVPTTLARRALAERSSASTALEELKRRAVACADVCGLG